MSEQQGQPIQKRQGQLWLEGTPIKHGDTISVWADNEWKSGSARQDSQGWYLAYSAPAQREDQAKLFEGALAFRSPDGGSFVRNSS